MGAFWPRPGTAGAVRALRRALILNDDAEPAQAAGADGVHVGQSRWRRGESGPCWGRQTHRRVRTHGGAGPAAQAAGPTTWGRAMFPTGMKQDTNQ